MRVGLREGRVLSSLLPVPCLNWIDSHSGVGEGGTTGNRRINSLFFCGLLGADFIF